jgi:uncharacterized membrane protein
MNEVHLTLSAIAAAAVLLLLPHFSPRGLFFGLTVPPEFPGSAAGKRSLRRYQMWVLLSVVASRGLARIGWPVLALPFVVGFAAFVCERAFVRRHAGPAPAVREAALTTGDDELPSWMPAAVLPFAAPLAAAYYLRAHWDEIPARFPVHWGLDGIPDRWSVKSEAAVFAPLVFGAAIMLAMLALSVMIFYGSRRSPQRLIVLKLLTAMISLMALVFSGAGLLPLTGAPSFVFLAAIPLFVVAMVIWSFRKVRQMPAEATPDAAWHLGAFYFNREDAAVFVQKRIGFGYTFNFGNGVSWVILGGLAGLVSGLAFLLPK